MEMSWSRWFRCESSFGLLLVPSQPGVYALAEEMVEPGPQTRRMLAVFEVDESTDLARSLSRLFAASSPWGQKLSESKCYLRYAVTKDEEQRHAALSSLRHWLETQRGVASQMFDFRLPASPAKEAIPVTAEAKTLRPVEITLEEDADEDELKTVAERAVDRVTRATEYAGVFPAGI